VSFFTVLGAANSAIAGYIKYAPITDVTIPSLVDYDVVFAGGGGWWDFGVEYPLSNKEYPMSKAR
jgi:hypothetical protein